MKIYLFYCSNSISREELAHCCRKLEGNELKTIGLPCSGKVNVPYMVKAFETGADGVVIVTCERGQCRHLEGNMRAEKRAQAVDSLLEEIGIGRGRIATIQLKKGHSKQVVGEVRDFCAGIGDLSRSFGQKTAFSSTSDSDKTQQASAEAKRGQ
jgi:F420-non-reducing hydrogenase iron-sulfur subunit